MVTHEVLQLMHVVLDGEATAEETQRLTTLVDADPIARAEYDQLRRLFEGLNHAQRAVAPEGLLNEVLAKVPRRHARRHRLRQLSTRWRVFISDSMRRRENQPIISAVRTQRSFQGEHNTRKAVMSEQTNKAKYWVVGAIAVVALVVASRYFDIPSSHDMSGTIAPAQRSVAVQPGAGDVTGTGGDSSQTGLQSTQTGAPTDAAIDAARSDASRADAAKLDAAKSDAAKADAGRLDAAKADAMKADAAKFDAAKSDAARADAAKFDAAKSDAAKADAARFDAAKSDAMKADAAKFDAAKSDAMKSDAAKFDAAKKDAVRSDAAKVDAARSAAARSDAAKPDASRSNQ